MTFAEIKTLTRKNLDDNNITFYSNDDFTDSFQDAYNDIVILTKCITKKIQLDWQQGLVYYDVVNSTIINTSVPDWLGTIAIFNNNTNRFLYDDLNLRQIHHMRNDWELAKGTPTHWVPVNNRYFAIYPTYGTAYGNYDLYYWAKAPTIIDTEVPLIATDMQSLLEVYVTADLIEQAEEYTKAQILWEEYYRLIEQYKERCENLSRADLLLLA